MNFTPPASRLRTPSIPERAWALRGVAIAARFLFSCPSVLSRGPPGHRRAAVPFQPLTDKSAFVSSVDRLEFEPFGLSLRGFAMAAPSRILMTSRSLRREVAESLDLYGVGIWKFG